MDVGDAFDGRALIRELERRQKLLHETSCGADGTVSLGGGEIPRDGCGR